MQSAFSKGKENRTMSINSQYIILFKNPRDMLTPTIFARQMYPNNSKKFMVKYMEATKRPFGYLFINLKHNTPDDQRLKADIFEGSVRKKSVYCNINQSSDLSTFPMIGEVIVERRSTIKEKIVQKFISLIITPKVSTWKNKTLLA